MSPALPGLSLALPGLLPALRGVPRLVIGDPRFLTSAPSNVEGRQDCPPRVWYSPEIDASKFTLHILSDTPGGFQWLKYIVLMSHCITYHRQVAFTHQRPSVSHVDLQESGRCNHQMRHVWVTKSMDGTTAGDHWSRCRHRLLLQILLLRSLIQFGSSCS